MLIKKMLGETLYLCNYSLEAKTNLLKDILEGFLATQLLIPHTEGPLIIYDYWKKRIIIKEILEECKELIWKDSLVKFILYNINDREILLELLKPPEIDVNLYSFFDSSVIGETALSLTIKKVGKK